MKIKNFEIKTRLDGKDLVITTLLNDKVTDSMLFGLQGMLPSHLESLVPNIIRGQLSTLLRETDED